MRAAIYTRVSTEDQAREGYSLGDQVDRCRALIEREGWQLTEVYEDAGWSGDDPQRPAYNRLLADAAAGSLDAVVVVALDRFGRDAWAVEGTLRFFDGHGVRLVSTREAIDRQTPEGTLQTGILAQFAQFEKAKIKARAKSGIAARARSGKPWGEPAYGYSRADDGWEPDPREADTVRRMYRYRAEDGMSYSGIARRLIAEGIPSRRGGNWTATTVKRTLESRHTLGYFEHGGEWIRGRHAAIVDEDLWLRAQALAAQGSKYAPSKGGRRPSRHLFINGHLRCGLCGEAMLPRGDWYECRTRKQIKGIHACDMPRQRREDVDGRFLSLFEARFLDLDKTRAHVAAELGRRVRQIDTQLANAERAVASAEDQRSRVEADYLSGDLGAASYERLLGRLDGEAAASVAQRDQLLANADEARRTIDNMDAEEETLRRLAALRDSVAAHARDAALAEDVVALRGVIAQAFEHAFLEPDGTIGTLTPGVAMSGPSLLVMGGEVLPGCDGSERELSTEADAHGRLRLRTDRYPITLQTGGEQWSQAPRCRASWGSSPRHVWG
ncbi:MAG TPA: recombinase family protein [Solirubrobacteraceae bacterium]|nr:recombinase family protein [Solirubrobacteraceae bacterium]